MLSVVNIYFSVFSYAYILQILARFFLTFNIKRKERERTLLLTFAKIQPATKKERRPPKKRD